MNVSLETQFILNTFSFLVSGVLVLWMAAGFAMLEAGMVRTKNVSTILLKNVTLFSIAAVMYLFAGYNLMYTGVDGGLIGTLGLWNPSDSVPTEAGQYASSSDWFFQMVFVATAASIVSGAVAERVKLWAFLAFIAVLTAVIYPIVGAWTWGGGWLSEMGFVDFAGSTIVHSTGGWAALVGVILIGPRLGKYIKKGTPMTTEAYERITAGWKHNPMPASNLPLATLGTFILFMGWFGFNGGSVLALGSASDAISMSNVYLNTAVAGAGGVLAAFLLSAISYKKIDITLVLNGLLAGLVAITAAPDTPLPYQAVLIGAVGGVIACYIIPLLDKLRVDDVVGAIPVHLVAGIWGTMAVPLTNAEASFYTQFVGVAAVGAFVMTASIIVWGLLRVTIGIRAEGHVEEAGLDKHDIGIDAYPEWQHAKLTDYRQDVI